VEVVHHNGDVSEERDGHAEGDGRVQAPEAVGCKKRVQGHARQGKGGGLERYYDTTADDSKGALQSRAHKDATIESAWAKFGDALLIEFQHARCFPCSVMRLG
jgi:hypothetical protein